MTALAPGENRPAPGDQLTITVASSASVDVSALLVNGAGRVRSDADFVFFNQPTGPGVAYRHGNGGPDVVGVQTSALPADVDKVVVTASLDGRGPTTFASVGALTATIESGSTALTFPISGLTTESGVVCVEIYRRNGAWKVRAIGQGYDDGLAGIASAFGVNLDDEPEVPAAQSAPVPPSQPPGYPSAPPPTYTQGNPVQQGQFAQPATPPPAYPGHGAPGQFVPPPAHQPQPSFSSQQGAQPVHSDLFDPSHAEVNGLGIQKQGGKMVKVGMNGEVMARSGSMVAYQGDLKFEALGSGGIGRAIRQHLTGEGVPLMKVSGRGDLFLANSAADVHIIDLDGTDGLTINGANVLAFDSTLRYDIGRVQGAAGYASNAGLFNCVFTGRGRIAITTHGSPVVLTVDQATYADPNAAVAWSSSLQTGIKRNDSFGLGRLMGRSTGEASTLAFSGRGFVIVQPSELPPGGLIGGTGGGQQAGTGGSIFG
ncbi:stress protein [Nocardia sp. Root136]|uniref:AIM24 family protein n=1 Tax=Nocardia sp. Root136 TaxID=1736458 RepID=UPI0006F41B75|nr:AIM24 family protein [Nocardia sp. Root136]KQY31692.1 stress protein [Nocardia sp. Root136]